MRFLKRAVLLFMIHLSLLVGKPLKSPRVVIVGAGLAGVSAAAQLFENGYEDVVILEAENRIGGRVHSVSFANGLIDLGAQWVHGETNNAIYDLVHEQFKFGDTGLEQTYPIFYKSNGKKADQKQCLKLIKLAEKILVAYPEMAEYKGSLGNFFTRRFERALKSQDFVEVLPELSNQMLDYYQKEINIWNGSETWFDLSARGNTISMVNTGNQFLTWRDKGYTTVFDFLTKKLPNPSKSLHVESQIQLKQKVVNIKSDLKSRSLKVEVTCEDGSKFKADHVIFTASLGVLKQNHETLFTPNLPKRKIKAIQTMGFGTVGKIFLEFEEPFWPTEVNDWTGFSFLWTRTDIESLRGSDREWLINIRSFIRVDSFPNTIEALLAGQKMSEFENLDDEKVVNDCMWLLAKFLGRILPRPINMRKTKWLTNNNFYGTYSYQSVEAHRNKIMPKDLAQSLFNAANKPVILFAGEATDDHFSSNAHGAVSSGLRAAQNIIDFYSNA